MDCAECHTPGTIHSGKQLILERAWTAQNGVPTDNIPAGEAFTCNMRFSVLGAGTSYVKTYQSRAKGPDGKIAPLRWDGTVMAGTQDITWECTAPSSPGPAKIIMQLKMRDEQGGNILGEVKKVHKFNIVAP